MGVGVGGWVGGGGGGWFGAAFREGAGKCGAVGDITWLFWSFHDFDIASRLVLRLGTKFGWCLKENQKSIFVGFRFLF